MDFLKSGLKTVLGTQEAGTQPSAPETVERLVDRVTSSTLLDDRRDACRALKAMSRKYRIEVGAQGMTALVQILEMDRADCEIIGYAMDTLCNITSTEQFEEELDNPTVTVNIGEQFTEMFIKKQENVATILNFLEEYDFRVRWPAIKFLTNLLANRPKEIQENILVSPMGVSKLMDLLGDSREVIRNDALLLLIQLTKGNANIQKIVAFENAFDRLFDVIKDEGCSDGGIVVEDCLILMLNLLKNNTSNQQFFKEGSYIQKLSPMLVIPAELEELGWTPQKVSNIHCMLQIVRALVAPNNPQHNISSCQKTMRSCGLLEALCNILMGSGVPADILTETINTVAEVVRGDISNQEYLSSVMAPSNPPRPAIVVLLMSMVNEKQPLPLRCAVLYCFESFLYRNEVGQTKLVQTLLPSSTEAPTLTSGQLLCGGLFSIDSQTNWFSAVSLMHGLIENPIQKEQLLRVLLATSIGSPPVSLLQQCTALLQQGNYPIQSKVGLLMLISVWLSNCPQAVKGFLTAPGSIAFLIAQISANEHDENEYLIQGLCAFVMGLCIQFNDNSIETSRRDDLCQLLVKRIGLETFSTKLGEVSKHESYSKAAKQPQIRVKSTNELMLDYEFCKLFKAFESIVIKSLQNYGDGNEINPTNEFQLANEANSVVVEQYKGIIREQDTKLKQYEENLRFYQNENEMLKKQLGESNLITSQLSDQNILMKAQLQAASDMNQQLQYTIQQNAVMQANSNETAAAVNHLENQMSSLNIDYQTQINFLQSENSRILNDLEMYKDRLNETEKHSIDNVSELEKLRKDQEDLLELLSDQDNKLIKYKQQLRGLGQVIEGSDDDDDDDDEDDPPNVGGNGIHEFNNNNLSETHTNEQHNNSHITDLK